MESRVRIIRARTAVTAALITGSLLAFAWAGAGPADAAVCHTATSNISKRKHISCKRAKRVARIVTRRSGVYPECRGDIARARGWVGRGLPKSGSGKGIKARFVKRKMSFILSGGGAC